MVTAVGARTCRILMTILGEGARRETSDSKKNNKKTPELLHVEKDN